MGDGWAWVSLSAYSELISPEEFHQRFPDGKPATKNNKVVSVDFSGESEDLRLEILLERLGNYLVLHRIQLLALRNEAEFRLHIGWTPLSPQECLVVPAQLLKALAELDVNIMFDGYGDAGDS